MNVTLVVGSSDPALARDARQVRAFRLIRVFRRLRALREIVYALSVAVSSAFLFPSSSPTPLGGQSRFLDLLGMAFFLGPQPCAHSISLLAVFPSLGQFSA